MTRSLPLIEPLESRIAPAITVFNPIFDITATTGQKGVSIDLAKMVDASKSYRTVVEFVTNFTLPGQSTPAVIQMELFDDKAPVTVGNFLRYLNNRVAAADYDGVFFHRLVQGFVLQGGGFNTSDPNTHLDTFLTVHNEFDPTDSERSNLLQTVAMAKVGQGQGGGAHSATSEFFVNLANNASNLDSQNGGFTVFGRITDSSMGVINAISSLPLYDSNGDGTGEVPVQNYTSGGGTPLPPTANQLISITDAHVVQQPGNDQGVEFTGISVKQADSAIDSKLVTGKINNVTNQLDLKFAAGLSGVVDVTVTMQRGGDTVTDTFQVTVLPNLIVDVAADGLKTTFVPGDKGTAKVTLSNNGGAVAKGKVNIKLYLSAFAQSSDGDVAGFTLDANQDTGDRLLATLNNVSVNIQPGKSVTIPVKYMVSLGLEDDGKGGVLVDGKSYRLLASVDSAGGGIQELYTDDNYGNFRKDNLSLTSSEVLRTFDFAFGSVGGRSNVPVTVPDANGDLVTFVLSGPGSGIVKNTDGTLSITLSGTTAASSLKVITGKGVLADLQDVEVNDTIGSIKLSNAHLHGHLRVTGGAKSIVMGDLGNTSGDPLLDGNHDISIGAFPIPTQKLALSFGEVHDYTLVSDMPVSTLTAKEWLDDLSNTSQGGDLSDKLQMAGLGSLKVTGDLEADVTSTGATKVSLFSVGGTVRDTKVVLLSDVSKVQIGDLTGSSFFAGLTAKPDDIGDFASAKSIASFVVKGTMANSVVAAGKLTSVSVAAIDATAGTEPGGFYADAIKSYVRKGVIKVANLDAPTADVDTVLPNYEVRIF